MSDIQESKATPDENKVQDVENVVENVTKVDENKNEATESVEITSDQPETPEKAEEENKETETPEAVKKTSRSVSFSEVVAENETADKESEPTVKVVPLTTNTSSPTRDALTTREALTEASTQASAALNDLNLAEVASGFSSWGSSLMSNIVNKTKNVAEQVVTTLDPGMANFMVDGISDIDRVNIVVCSSQQVKIEPISEAWKRHWPYGSVHVRGVPAQPKSVPDQPVGASAALQGCRERIDAAIVSVGKAQACVPAADRLRPENQAPNCYIAVENYVTQILPDQWFDIACLLLRDIRRNKEFLAFSQATPIPNDLIELAKEKDDGKSSQGWSHTIGKLMVDKGISQTHRDWHEAFAGVSRRTCIYQAARTLAHQYISLVYSTPKE